MIGYSRTCNNNSKLSLIAVGAIGVGLLVGPVAAPATASQPSTVPGATVADEPTFLIFRAPPTCYEPNRNFPVSVVVSSEQGTPSGTVMVTDGLGRVVCGIKTLDAP